MNAANMCIGCDVSCEGKWFLELDYENWQKLQQFTLALVLPLVLPNITVTIIRKKVPR